MKAAGPGGGDRGVHAVLDQLSQRGDCSVAASRKGSAEVLHCAAGAARADHALVDRP
jgi:hypothetical protein